MKHKIQITGKNIDDLFRLPCVYEIRKDILPVPGNVVISQSGKHIEVNARASDSVYSDVLTAHYGDWLVEDDSGNWHVEKVALKRLSMR